MKHPRNFSRRINECITTEWNHRRDVVTVKNESGNPVAVVGKTQEGLWQVMPPNGVYRKVKSENFEYPNEAINAFFKCTGITIQDYPVAEITATSWPCHTFITQPIYRKLTAGLDVKITAEGVTLRATDNGKVEHVVATWTQLSERKQQRSIPIVGDTVVSQSQGKLRGYVYAVQPHNTITVAVNRTSKDAYYRDFHKDQLTWNAVDRVWVVRCS